MSHCPIKAPILVDKIEAVEMWSPFKLELTYPVTDIALKKNRNGPSLEDAGQIEKLGALLPMGH